MMTKRLNGWQEANRLTFVNAGLGFKLKSKCFQSFNRSPVIFDNGQDLAFVNTFSAPPNFIEGGSVVPVFSALLSPSSGSYFIEFNSPSQTYVPQCTLSRAFNVKINISAPSRPILAFTITGDKSMDAMLFRDIRRPTSPVRYPSHQAEHFQTNLGRSFINEQYP